YQVTIKLVDDVDVRLAERREARAVLGILKLRRDVAKKKGKARNTQPADAGQLRREFRKICFARIGHGEAGADGEAKIHKVGAGRPFCSVRTKLGRGRSAV